MAEHSYSEFIEALKLHGLEAFGLFYGCYRGEVVSNQDPDNLGRLKIKCAPLYGDQTLEDWVMAKGVPAGLGTGIFWLPSAGDPVFIICEGGDPRFPLWEYGWWLRDKMIPGAKPKVYVFLTPTGHRIELNDETNTVDVKHKDGFHVKLFNDGIYLGKQEKNLGKFLDDLFELFKNTKVATQGGPQPFINAAAYEQLRVIISQFLKTSE